MEQNQLYNNPTLRKAQLIMVEMLGEVDRICRAHGLRYWIDYGTLLGAVRHEGHCIPWDDDMDLCMPSEDYRMFWQYAQQELNPKFFLQSEQSDPTSTAGIGNLRLRDKSSLMIFYREDFSNTSAKGVFIDIFEMVPSPKLPFKTFRWMARRISFAYNFFKYNPHLNFHNIVCYFWYPIQRRLFKAIWLCLPTDKRVLTPRPEMYGYSSFLHEDDLYPLQEIDFEGLRVFAPKDPIKRLLGIYGDFMKIPAPEKRRVHARYLFLNIEDNDLKLSEK